MIEEKNQKIIEDFLSDCPTIIAGPCAVESAEQINRISKPLAEAKIRYLRGGAYKPRTSPRSFQGLGPDGLKLLRQAADDNGMLLVSELTDSLQLEEYTEMIDIIQIGSRNMDSYALLKEIGKATAWDGKPVLLKRGYYSTLREFVLAADYIRDAGNPNVIMCLRGIRTFEQIDSAMRFTPDLASIVELKEMIHDQQLPIIFDPSHATGQTRFVLPIARAALDLGADGLMIETHDRPSEALSDADQSIMPSDLLNLMTPGN